ncbi:diguanylate cyclase (GGDEF)-like protein/PAS domain S-box-containing protein [Saccharothrix coeruleofusca]|uniref:putative bifunctional diguanylate cyclase/phosphodiesterase n=1 Tax=Saccharothrix coeruleofusca TaxID=33919 RepID=UPI001AE43853|nr:EAL domain-containing protein [Saccharothrix coeruleofusca]MBP2336922.1 diguanylate cyclase (GGDEF)-like protein/PAS domain S-box-containing protein [Saccharothrix coeruleofusca]
MTAPLPRDAAGLRERVKLARKWAYLLSKRTYLPMSQAELERQLLGLVERLCAGVVTGPLAHQVGREVGVALVEMNCTLAETLRLSVEVISRGLLDMTSLRGIPQRRDRVVEVVAALASGFAEKLRLATLEQQEQLGRALHRAMRQVQLDLQASEARTEVVETFTSSGVATTDLAGQVLRANDALARIVDLPPAAVTGLSLPDLVHPDQRDAVRADFARLAAGSGEVISQPRRLLRADGETAWVTLTLTPLRLHDGRGQVVVLAEDSSDVSLLQGQLNHQSLHDLLTWLPNRQYFTSRLEQALRTADPATGISVFHLDLDGFSLITGGLGRRVGDQVLKTVALRLREVVAEEVAMVARFGYDEFAILVENSASTPDVVTLVRRINDRLSEPFDAGGHRVATSATIGVVHRPPSDASPSDLLDSADLTLRRAKGGGRRQWELADPTQDGRDRRRFSLAVTMPGAWEGGELRVRYRPLARLADSALVAAEAVLRWDHPKLGALPHEQCLALAEDTGLVGSLLAWLLRTACEQSLAWRRDRGRELPVRVGVTASQAADQELVGAVLGVLADTGLPPRLLRLGLPAAAVLDEDEAAADNARILAESGVVVEVDDFSAAPGELVRVAELPVASVRITLSRGPVPGGPPGGRVVADLLAVVRDAGVAVAVDGLSSVEQARWWREAGADTGSGPLFASPSPPEVIAARLG